MFKPHDWLDGAFEIGIIGKGLNGLIEIVGGLLLLFTTPDRLHQLVFVATRAELSEDPHDFIATHLLHTTSDLTGGVIRFAAIYLLIHGVVKVILVIALLLDKLLAYPCMIAVLLLFIGYQLYRILLNPTAGLIALTIFDALVVTLTWLEYGRKRRTAATRLAPSATDPTTPPTSDRKR